MNSSLLPRAMQQPAFVSYNSQYNYMNSGAVDDEGTSIVKQRRALNAENYRNGVERQVYNTAYHQSKDTEDTLKQDSPAGAHRARMKKFKYRMPGYFHKRQGTLPYKQ